MEQQGSSKSNLKNARLALNGLNEYKPLPECTENDINKYLVSLKDKYKDSTINIRKHYIKKYFTENDCAERVKSLKVKPPSKFLDPKDILSPDEVNRMIKATESKMYKALFATLYETGGRISEILNLKVGDTEETAAGMVVILNSEKTKDRTGVGYRKMLLKFAGGYIREYLLYTNLGKDDKLFPVSRPAVHTNIKKVAAKAGITKNISAHTFRHSSATKDVKDGMQESIIRKKFGWTPSSNMIERYIQLNDEAVIEWQVGGSNSDTKLGDIEKVENSMLDELQRKNKELEEQNKAILEKLASLEMTEEAIIERLMKRFPSLGAEA